MKNTIQKKFSRESLGKLKTQLKTKLKTKHAEWLKKTVQIRPLLAGAVLLFLLVVSVAGVQAVFSGLQAEQTELRETQLYVTESVKITEQADPSESESGSDQSGFRREDGVLYCYNADGSRYLGWRLQDENWYYFTEEGAAVGYYTISEYGREDECYFDADGHLVMNAQTPDGRMADSDGYLEDEEDAAAEAEDWSAFEVEAAKNMTPGALSGIQISGKPAEFYMLSIAGESSGGQILIGDRGRAYGLCQFDYRHDLTGFIRWAYARHPSLWKEFSAYTEKAAGDESLVENNDILQAFINARKRNYEAAISDELEYMRMDYWDSFASRMNAAGYRLSERHISVSAAFFSVLVNCGKKVDVFLENLSPDMTDAQMICGIYKIRNTILAEQNVGRSRKGTTTRYRMAEPQMALDLLHGYTTIDSVKDYGGGVQWNGNLFTGTVMTSALAGNSTEWEEALLAPSEDPEETELETMEEMPEEDTEESTFSETTAAVSKIVLAGKAAAKETEEEYAAEGAVETEKGTTKETTKETTGAHAEQSAVLNAAESKTAESKAEESKTAESKMAESDTAVSESAGNRIIVSGKK